MDAAPTSPHVRTTVPLATATAWWTWAMLGSALTLALGGLLHPQEDETLSGIDQTSAWLGNPWWVPSHVLLLLAEVLVFMGLIGIIVGRRDLAQAARIAGVAAVLSVGLWLVEGVPHLLAAGDADAIAHGHGTPSFTLFQQLSPVVYPLVGLSVAVFALLAGRRLSHPALVAIGVVGGTAYAVAPVAEGVFGLDSLDFLYAVGLLMAVWFAGVGLTELVRRPAPGGAPAP